MNWQEGRDVLNQKRKDWRAAEYRKSKYFNNVIVFDMTSSSWFMMIDDVFISGQKESEFIEMFAGLRKTNSLKVNISNKKYCIWTYDIAELYYNHLELFKDFEIFKYGNKKEILYMNNSMFTFMNISARTGKSKDEYLDGVVNEEEILLKYKNWVEKELSVCEKVDKIPTTQTQALKLELKKKCGYQDKDGISSLQIRRNWAYGYDKGQYTKLDWSDPHIIDLFTEAFLGGYMTYNNEYWGKDITDALIFDRCSAYPAIIATEKLPYRFKQINNVKEFIAKTYNDNYATMGVYVFKGLSLKKGKYPYITYRWCCDRYNKGIILYEHTPRVIAADYIELVLYDLTFQDIMNTYDCEDVQIAEMFVAEKRKVDDDVIDVMLDNFAAKTMYKNVKGKEFEYTRSKEHLNASFGIMGERLVRDGEYKDPCAIGSNTLFYYPWGGYISAIQRHIMAELVSKIGSDFIYSNTDSLVIKNTNKAIEVIKEFNLSYLEKIDNLGYELDRVAPFKPDGNRSFIGVFEKEAAADIFKFVGINRYFYSTPGSTTIKLGGIEDAEKKFAKGLGNVRECINKIFDIYIEGGVVIIENGLVAYDRRNGLTKIYTDYEFSQYSLI